MTSLIFNLWLNLWKDERGQDLIEYSILISFIAVAVVGLFIGPGNDVKNIWTISNNQLTQANTRAS
jgi:Flp pilus assembly pilin Flp